MGEEKNNDSFVVFGSIQSVSQNIENFKPEDF